MSETFEQNLLRVIAATQYQLLLGQVAQDLFDTPLSKLSADQTNLVNQQAYQRMTGTFAAMSPENLSQMANPQGTKNPVGFGRDNNDQ